NEDGIVSDGFTGLRLKVPVFEAVRDEQIGILEGEEFESEARVDELVERLSLRLGNDGVVKAEAAESYVPEKAYAWQISVARASCPCRVQSVLHGQDARATESRASSPCHAEERRPLHLFSRPVEIGVIVSPSH